jgi:SAM-dependent methyltransferase
MKRCLSCGHAFDAIRADCPACGTRPLRSGGFDAYAPALAEAGGGFEPRFFDDLAQLEAGNFWFRARNNLILWALRKYAPDFQSFLEIGCGTGFVLAGVAGAFPGRRLSGSEIFSAGLAYAATRVPEATLMQMDARDIPFVGEFDVAGAFDVLEHIDDDVRALQQIHAAVKPGGLAIFTVPQHQWLWSAVDEYACHRRRYAASELSQKVRDAGFEVLRDTSFVTLLLPAMVLSRFQQKRRSETFDAASELKIGKTANALLEQVLNIELAGIRLGLSYPAGGSRLVVARKGSGANPAR